MTRMGKEKLEKELAYLSEIKREELGEQIKEARGFCDFSEDASFSEMVDERLALEERIQTIKSMLDRAQVIDPEEATSTTIKLGSTVTFVELPDGEEETYTIVGTADANPSEYTISYQSPIAKSLLGHQENEQVFIQTPAGKMKVKIVHVS